MNACECFIVVIVCDVCVVTLRKVNFKYSVIKEKNCNRKENRNKLRTNSYVLDNRVEYAKFSATVIASVSDERVKYSK